MFGDHCAGVNLIKRGAADDDDGLPRDTSALVMLDKATGWIAVYPKASKSTLHTIEAMQHFAGPMTKHQEVLLRQRFRANRNGKSVQVAPCHGYERGCLRLAVPLNGP